MSKVYFDVTWQGPVLDANYRPTGKVEGEQSSAHLPLGPLHSSDHHFVFTYALSYDS